MPKTNDQQVFYDGLFSMQKGMDLTASPLLLPRDQAAYILNGTTRTDFLTHRPPVRQMVLDFGGNSSLQSAFENNYFQGGCFYQPDFGAASLMGAISGRLFQCSINGNTLSVSERTVPSDPNPASQPQAWLWQSENYVIWNDGLSLPVFFDGATSRRSFGSGQLIATISSNFTVPSIGSVVTVTLSANYTGQYNIPVNIKGNLYQTVKASSGGTGSYSVTLTTLYDTVGATIPANSAIIFNPNIFGVQAANQVLTPGQYTSENENFPTLKTLPLTLAAASALGVGTQINLFGGIWQVHSVVGTAVTIFLPFLDGGRISQTVNVPASLPAGTTFFISGSSQPTSTVATTKASFVVSPIGSPATVTTFSPYVGLNNAIVYIGAGQYRISGDSSAPPVTNSLGLINIDATPGVTINAPVDINGLSELPAGRMGTYGMGRNWMSLTDGISFIAGDIVGGSAGTQANSFRDAVLKVTENSYLSGGGVFRVPGSVGDIRAMKFAATLDSSLGQGPLQVYTGTTVFSCNAPVDRSTWQSLTNPILTESLIGNGALGQNSTILANGDTFFRSVDGVRSLILARREFDTWGNVPLSIEVQDILRADDKSLLAFGSGAVFDNRLMITAGPVNSSNGVYHRSLVVLNFDPLLSIDEKIQPVYDGQWTGVNVLQFVQGMVQGVQRTFAFTVNASTNKIEVYEFLDDGNFDNDTVPIVWGAESCSLFKEIKGKGVFDLVQLEDGEIYVDEVVGRVDFRFFYKPDQYPCWVPWHSWSICAEAPNALSPQPTDAALKPQFKSRMGLGKPSPDDCDPNTGFLLREGSTFQLKWLITGHCRLLGVKVKAIMLPDVEWAKPVCDEICDTCPT